MRLSRIKGWFLASVGMLMFLAGCGEDTKTEYVQTSAPDSTYLVEYLPGMTDAAQGKTTFQVRVRMRSDGSPATGLAPEQKKKIGSLSKGYRQRVGLAQALIHDPSVLILDEATTGLDPNQIVEIRTLIKEAGREKTVMLSTHIMQEVEAICDRVIIIDKGIIVANETKNNIYSRLRQPDQVIQIEFDKEISAISLPEIENIRKISKIKNNIWIIEAEGEADIRPALFNFAVRNGLTVLSLQKNESNLEEVFRHLTNG